MERTPGRVFSDNLTTVIDPMGIRLSTAWVAKRRKGAIAIQEASIGTLVRPTIWPALLIPSAAVWEAPGTLIVVNE